MKMWIYYLEKLNLNQITSGVMFYWAKTYEKMYENILLLTWFLDFDDIFQRWYIPSKKKKNQAFMLQAIKYQLERINIKFDEWFERVNKRDA